MNDLVDHFARVAWASGEISSIAIAVASFEASDPVEIKWHYSLETGQKIYKASQTTQPPKEISIRSGVVIHELRATLDALACTLANRNNAEALKGVYFPAAKSLKSYDEKQTQQKIAKLSAADQDRIRSLKPYKGGNDIFYALHEADLIGKHQRLILNGNVANGLMLQPGLFDPTKFGRIGVQEGPLHNQVVAVMAPGYEQPFKLGVSIGFGEPDFIKNKPVVTTLRSFVDLVTETLEVFQISEV